MERPEVDEADETNCILLDELIWNFLDVEVEEDPDVEVEGRDKLVPTIYRGIDALLFEVCWVDVCWIFWGVDGDFGLVIAAKEGELKKLLKETGFEEFPEYVTSLTVAKPSFGFNPDTTNWGFDVVKEDPDVVSEVVDEDEIVGEVGVEGSCTKGRALVSFLIIYWTAKSANYFYVLAFYKFSFASLNFLVLSS